jgi:hypothetical protein
VQSLSSAIGRWDNNVGRSVPQYMSHAGISALKSRDIFMRQDVPELAVHISYFPQNQHWDLTTFLHDASLRYQILH